MEDLHNGRLYPITENGSEGLPIIMKRNKMLLGSDQTCDIRIYSEGVLPEHCVFTVGYKKQVYLEPLSVSALILINHAKIEKIMLVKQNDIITIMIRSFRFAYPPDSILSKISYPFPGSVIEPLICHPERVEPKSCDRKSERLVKRPLRYLVSPSKRFASGVDTEETVAKKKVKFVESEEKRVRFGPRLTPEEFDKRLPPSSPLRKGSLPGEKRSLNVDEPSILKRSNMASEPLKISRGTPLLDKSLNIKSETHNTFTVNAEIHPNPQQNKMVQRTKTGSPVKSTKPCSPTICTDHLLKKNPLGILKSALGSNLESESGTMPCDDIQMIEQSTIAKKLFLAEDHVSPDSSNPMTSLHKQQKPLFSDILKKKKVNSPEVSTTSQQRNPKSSACIKKSMSLVNYQKNIDRIVHPQILTVGSTGHANSPDTIIIRKRRPVSQVEKLSEMFKHRSSPRTPRRRVQNFERENAEKEEDLKSELTENVYLEKKEVVEKEKAVVKDDIEVSGSDKKVEKTETTVVLTEAISTNINIGEDFEATEDFKSNDQTVTNDVKILEKQLAENEEIALETSLIDMGKNSEETYLKPDFSDNISAEKEEEFGEQDAKETVEMTPNQRKTGRENEDILLEAVSTTVTIGENSEKIDDSKSQLLSNVYVQKDKEDVVEQAVKKDTKRPKRGKKWDENRGALLETASHNISEDNVKSADFMPQEKITNELVETGVKRSTKQSNRGRKAKTGVNENQAIHNILTTSEDNVKSKDVKKIFKQPSKGRKAKTDANENQANPDTILTSRHTAKEQTGINSQEPLRRVTRSMTKRLP